MKKPVQGTGSWTETGTAHPMCRPPFTEKSAPVE